MGRNSAGKAAASAVADEATPADAGEQSAPEQEATKAEPAEGAPPAEPAIKQEPEPEPEPEQASDGPAILVRSVAATGRWRAGRHFTPEPQRVLIADLGEGQLEAIQADPFLVWQGED